MSLRARSHSASLVPCVVLSLVSPVQFETREASERLATQAPPIPVSIRFWPSSRRCWNAVNDVVFGWLSDHCCTRRTRRPDSIRWGGWVWVSAFVLMWLPIPPSPAPGVDWSIEELSASLYFLLVLCVYDGGLTFVEVNHSALLAEVCVLLGALCVCVVCAVDMCVHGSAYVCARACACACVFACV